jgi:esterase/lipase
MGVITTNVTNVSVHSQLREWLVLYESEKRLQHETAKFVFDQSKTYHAVVMGLAYGGFFALWSSANGFLVDKKLLALAGALMTVSIVSFVIFTIMNMYALQRATLKHVTLADTYGTPKTLEDFQASVKTIAAARESANSELQKLNAALIRCWAPFFFTSLICGSVAALIMLYLLLAHHGLGLF